MSDVHKQVYAMVGAAMGAALTEKALQWQRDGATGDDVRAHVRVLAPALREIHAEAIEAAYAAIDRLAGIAAVAPRGVL